MKTLNSLIDIQDCKDVGSALENVYLKRPDLICEIWSLISDFRVPRIVTILLFEKMNKLSELSVYNNSQSDIPPLHEFIDFLQENEDVVFKYTETLLLYYTVKTNYTGDRVFYSEKYGQEFFNNFKNIKSFKSRIDLLSHVKLKMNNEWLN